jgi:hypothetical protein
MQQLLRGLSDDELRFMAAQSGLPSLSPAELRAGGLPPQLADPTMMARVAELQASLPPELRGGRAAQDPESLAKVAEVMAQKPELAESMSQVGPCGDVDM